MFYTLILGIVLIFTYKIFIYKFYVWLRFYIDHNIYFY